MAMKQKRQTVGDLYPGYLHAADIDGPLRLTIERVDVRSIPMPGGFYKWSAIVSFVEDPRRLIANKTQSQAIAAIAGSDAFDSWAGTVVVLSPGLSANKRPTICVEAAEAP